MKVFLLLLPDVPSMLPHGIVTEVQVTVQSSAKGAPQTRVFAEGHFEGTWIDVYPKLGGIDASGDDLVVQT